MNTDAIVGDAHLAEPVYVPLDEEILPAEAEESHTFDVLAEENAEPAYTPPPSPPPEYLRAHGRQSSRSPQDPGQIATPKII